MATNALERAAPQLPAVSETVALLDVIKRAAADPAVDVEKMERLMGMHERITAKQAEAAFNSAMSAVQSSMQRVAADASNPQTRSKYASFAALDRALRPLYSEHGLALSYDTGDGAPEGYVRVLCHVSHREGHTRTYRADIPADGKGAKGGDVMTKTHAMGSAFTYGQRYLLKLIFNVAVGEDDDGNVAGGPTISSKQAADLEAMADEVGANKPAFLKYLGAGAFASIPASKYRDAVAALEKKRNAK